MTGNHRRLGPFILALCIAGIGGLYLAGNHLLNWALQDEARSRGLDWAHHIEHRLPALSGMRDENGGVDATRVPLPQEFYGLVEAIFNVGNIYQIDYINTLCFCELSLGSFQTPDGQRTSFADDAKAHDHRAHTPYDAPVLPSEEFLEHLFHEDHAHEHPRAFKQNKFQLPVDRDQVAEILAGGTSQILIRSDQRPYQPTTFAEVYYPVQSNGEIAYLLRVLVNLEAQSVRYTQFLLIGTLISVLAMSLAFGYPMHRYIAARHQQRETHERAQFLAHHDVLTNLNNRNDFQESGSDILWACRDKNQAALLFLFDLNDFKEVNDYYGHQIGDRLLCQFADQLKHHVPEGGYIARLGGDEFVVMLGGISNQHIRHQDHLQMPKSISLQVDGVTQAIEATISGGVVQYPRDGTTIEELIQAADLALYAAKPNRGGEVREYSAQMKREFNGRLDLREEFREALRLSQIEPHYQPIIDLETGKVRGFEALARWRHPTRGLLSPYVFADVFEDPETGADLGTQMFNKVVNHMAFWKDHDVPYGVVGINVINGDLKRKDFSRDILHGMQMQGLPPEELAIEITENCLFGSSKQEFIRHLKVLRDAGCAIALDDFGTGFSSITQLKEMPITTVKIDKSFVEDVIQDKADQSIISALLNLGKSMQFDLIIEGVEGEDQLQFLHQMGVQLIQGYYFSVPIAAEDVPSFIERHNAGYDVKTLHLKAG